MADASSGASSSVAHLVEQPDRPYQSAEAMPGQQSSSSTGQLFAATTTPSTPSTYDTTSYKEVMSRLDSLWTDKSEEIENLTEDHWKSQDFPLARIKKIMRMDEDVKVISKEMISTEVPIMFSKVLEIFITELTMRSWLHTEESKRRTVQRSDIAMAITKNDMFDFLIDIVPREEIQLKTKAQKEGGESVQLLPPDMLQDYIQQIINQTFATMGSVEDGGDESSSTVNTLQQLQLIQQLAQLQQVQQDQQQQQQQSAGVGQQLQHVVQTPSGPAGGHYDTTGGGGVDVRVLQSSTTTSANQQAIVQLDSTTVGSALEKIAENSSGRFHAHSGDGDIGRGLHGSSGERHTRDLAFGQQTLHHVNPPQGFHQQQQQQQQSIFSNNQHPQITTVVIPQPMSPVPPPTAVSTASMALDSAGFPNLHQTHDLSQEEGRLRDQLESLATEQFISHRVPVELSSPSSLQGREEGGEGPGNDEVMVTADDRMGYQNIPEGELIPGPISPIRGMSSGTGVVFPPDKT